MGVREGQGWGLDLIHFLFRLLSEFPNSKCYCQGFVRRFVQHVIFVLIQLTGVNYININLGVTVAGYNLTGE